MRPKFRGCTERLTKAREGHTNTQVLDSLANRQILGKRRVILFRHNGDLAHTDARTHTHACIKTQFCSVSFKSANLS